ncbi:hypothetical protein NL108_013804 [Boleophthalmus pectinirostris]|uniref:uncharacterized protein LOC129409858 n=1 Tax=Boleophthalmus pectinirostris TaxID=150288 RepID=UPI00242B479E|nr:uncharacterized protein LOC129409858 [Boleophthalmus pectinirostris]XP_055012692.1 uncharacterized protein LOC129409858 [Boleophthalmus pectinirostris]KAJ0055850.1 hypothetical protein NL108_013804 [Boleophthalmus pectinirostris]
MAEEEEQPDVTDVLGDVADVVDIVENVVDISSTAGGLLSKALPNRQCSVQIQNECSTYILCNPRVHTDTGICKEPLNITIKPSCSGKGLFTKSPRSMRGTGAVFSYDLYDQQQCVGKVAALFKVPYDLNLHSIVFAIGFVDSNTECDKHLFKRMFKNEEEGFVRAKAKGSSVTSENDLLTIKATMSNSGDAVMKIEVSAESRNLHGPVRTKAQINST